MPELPRRNPDGTFNSESDAYEFAVTVLQIRRGAKGGNYVRGLDGELQLEQGTGCGATTHEDMVCDAIGILQAVIAHDISTERRWSWFADFFMASPTNPPEPFTPWEMGRLTPKIYNFRCNLVYMRYLGHCGRRNCKKGLDRFKRRK